MTAALTSAEEIRDLLDGLEPPCAARNPLKGDPCDRPAKWIAWLIQRGRPLPKILHCDVHKQASETHYRVCVGCRDRYGLEYRFEPIAVPR